MPSDWQRALIGLAATVIGAAVIALLFWARAIFIPVALAIFLAFVLAPLVTRVQHRGLGRTPSVIITVSLVLLISLSVGALLVQQVAQLANTLPDRSESIKEKLIAARHWVTGGGESRFGQMVDDVTGILSPKPAQPEQKVVIEPGSPLGSSVDNYLTPAAAVLGQTAFTFVLTVYMLLRREDLRNRMIRLLGGGRVTTTTKAVDDASQRISKYLLSQFMVNSAFGAVIALGLFALGVKYSILWGFIGTLMRYVPYIGTWIGLIPPVLFSFATAPAWGGGWGQPICVFVLFFSLEIFCGNVVEPAVYGKSMGLSEVAQLVAAAFWAFLWGPIGLILSGPLTVCLLVLGRHVSRYNFFVVLLGDEPALEPKVSFYQRLTARDQDEAADVAHDVAEKTSPEATFDEVIIPALCIARRDHEEDELDAATLRFVIAAAHEIGDEVAERIEVPPPNASVTDRARVLLSPARDDAEHVAVALFGRTLDRNRWEVQVAGAATLASELIDQVAEFQPAVVVIASMPPGGLSHARYLLARLRQRFPDVKLLIGRWGAEETPPEGRGEALKNTDGVDYTLAATHKRLTELHALVTAKSEPARERTNKKELVGTGNA